MTRATGIWLTGAFRTTPRGVAMICVLLAFLAAVGAGAAPPPTAGTDDEPKYFAEPNEWQFRWGTDTALTVSNIESGSSNETNDRTTNYDAVWMRLYGRVLYKDSVELLIDIYSANGIAPSIFGLYARLQPRPWAGLRVGILPLVVGGWQERAYPSRQPLINQPLFAQYLLPIRSDTVPKDVDELLGKRALSGTPYSIGPTTGGSWLTLAYEHCWDTGIEAFGQRGGLRYRAAVMDGSPGSAPTKSRDQRTGHSLEGRLTYQIGDALRLGVSGAQGPYLRETINPYLPAGRSFKDYDQRLVGADARVRLAPFELHAEWMANAFESPYVAEQLRTTGYYGELAFTVRQGVQLAARHSGLHFSDVRDASGQSRPWYDNMSRLEAGGVYRSLDDHLTLKAVYQETRWEYRSDVERIYALQLSFFY